MYCSFSEVVTLPFNLLLYMLWWQLTLVTLLSVHHP